MWIKSKLYIFFGFTNMTDTFLWTINAEAFKLTGLTTCCKFQHAMPATGSTPATEAGYVTTGKCMLQIPVDSTWDSKPVAAFEDIDICELVGTAYNLSLGQSLDLFVAS